jgi:acyl-CoA reductase-like NAD-dependent aldehyde dehydrogenase
MVPGPRGVVAVLTPWNDPVAVAAGLLGAALVTGNTVVHKPSERCPLTGRRFAELLAAHLPEGVLEIVDGDGSVGAQLAGADVDVVAHVGSSRDRPGDRARVRPTGAKAVLENGGNDPLIVDEGVDPAWGRGAGRARGVRERRADLRLRRADLLPRRAAPTRSSPRSRGGARLGGAARPARRPAAPRPRARPRRRGARRRRARADRRGGARRPGCLLPADRADRLHPQMRVMREETFGRSRRCASSRTSTPRCWRRVHDDYGLAATVLTADMAHAPDGVAGLPVGTVKINNVFGGHRAGPRPAAPGRAGRASGTGRNCSTR